MSTKINTSFLKEIYRDIKPFLKQREFQLFDFITRNKMDSEMYISQVLAFLLDPRNPHFLGSIPLSCFLEILDIHNKNDFDIEGNINIRVEQSLTSQRRHDIVIESDKWIISVENKIKRAKDQPKQVESYIKDMQSSQKHWFMVYLSVDGDPPTSNSIDKKEWKEYCDQNRATTLSAQSLTDWIDKILQSEIAQDVGKKLKMKFFLADFKAYIKEKIMGETNSKEIIQQILESMGDDKEKWEMFFNIKNSYEDILYIKKEEITKQLKEKYMLEDTNPNPNHKYQMFLILDLTQNLKLGIEQEKGKNYDNWYWGILNKNSNHILLQDKEIQSILKNCFPNGKKSSSWYIWEYFHNSQEIYLEILTGNFIRTIEKKCNEINKLIEEYINENPEIPRA